MLKSGNRENIRKNDGIFVKKEMDSTGKITFRTEESFQHFVENCFFKRKIKENIPIVPRVFNIFNRVFNGKKRKSAGAEEIQKVYTPCT